MKRSLFFLGLIAFCGESAAAQGVIAGTVVGADGRAVDLASVRATRAGAAQTREGVTDSAGAFRIAGLAAGTYTVNVRRVGYRSAELPGIRVADGQTRTLSVTLTQAPAQLSTIEVVTSPTAVDASTTALTMRLDRTFTELLPSARDASSLVALVPGARKDQLWGGAPGVSNDYRLDGVSMNHPGLGGDFLSLSVDWIETLEVKGLGVGAESGNFQGGVVNAITKSGTNERRMALRTNYESPRLTATNFNANELGAEQAGRREFGGEFSGPIVRDRLFYFAAGQHVLRDVRSPDLTTTAAHDFQSTQESHEDARGLAKLTWLPAAGQRVDALGGFATFGTEHAGLNGSDAASATHRVRQPTSYYALSWTLSRSASVVDVRVAGFNAWETRRGYAGADVPAVQLLRVGTLPAFQNSVFNERLHPTSATGSVQWRVSRHTVGLDHQILAGGEWSRSTWFDERLRNGGMTWRPFADKISLLDTANVMAWGRMGSDWGGEIRLHTSMLSRALYLQDNVGIGSRVTVSPGLRYGYWKGRLLRECARCVALDSVQADAVEPRLGVSWDVTGHNTTAVKAHWGRYHQGMFALFFDRLGGSEVYTNQRFYYFAPPQTDSRNTYTESQRGAAGSGFSSFYDEITLDESGRVDRYRQPYVDQWTLGLERSIGARWKAELILTKRVNKDIVGLVDRNVATNYSPVYAVRVEHRFASGRVLDANGDRLVLPAIWVSNLDLKATLNSCGDNHTTPCAMPIAGYTAAGVAGFPWHPDLVLTAVPNARREYKQATFMLRSSYARWRGEASMSAARLKGNVSGVTGYGTTGSRFSAGPFVRPNEAINFDGVLPDAQQLEAKVWLTARLPLGLQGGALFTHTYREMFAPTFEILGRYVYTDTLGNPFPSDLFKHALGQSILVEPRGKRFYPTRDILDLHLEWRTPARAVVAVDLFNATGSNAITLINTNIGDQTPTDPTSVFAAPRLRVAPRTLRVGVRID